jgi:lysophospholipase L1-like esterase
MFSFIRSGRITAAFRLVRAWTRALLLVAPLTLHPVRAAETWDYTALGDSLAFGLFAPVGKGYVPLYRGYVASDNGVSVTLTNLGIPGWTSDDLLAAIRSSAIFRFSVARSSVVTWDIGGNDLSDARDQYKARTCGGPDNQDCLRNAVTRLKSNWSGIIAEILSLRSANNTIIRTMDIYNPFVNADKSADTWPGDQGNDFMVLKPYLDEINSYILTTSAARNIPCARVYQAFNGPNGEIDPATRNYLAFDDYHPNTRGHRVIADLFRGLGYAPLRP